MNRKKWIKASLALSACLFVLWWALGTGATLAWFSDTDAVRNEFQIGLLKLDVSYKNDIVTEYTPLQGATKAFYEEALYEPGYTQVVYLKIENKGDVDFRYKVAVTVKGPATDENGNRNIYLTNYLRYGVVFAKDEAELKNKVKDRLQAQNIASNDWGSLGTWAQKSDFVFQAGEDAHYVAIILHMPKEVGNEANYRDGRVLRADLGITVFAQQANAPME